MTYGEEFSAIVRAIADALAENEKGALQPLEQQLLCALLQNPTFTYPQIREVIHSDYGQLVSAGHLRNTASKLRNKLACVLGTKPDKRNLVAELQTWYERKQRPDVFGRNSQIEILINQYLQNSYYRIVCVTGMPRIGKSTLVSAAISLLRKRGMAGHPLPDIHWRAATDVPTVDALLHWITQRIYGSGHKFEPPEDSVEALIHEMHRNEN